MTTFVDGYNLIFAASRRLAGFDIARTESAREKLLELLARYRAVRAGRIVVFFDGGPEAAHLPRRQMVRGLEVVFSDANSDADADIKNAVSREAHPAGIRVVTSDAAIRAFVQRCGATVVDSIAFLDEILAALKERSLPNGEPLEKYEGGPPPSDEADYWLKVFGEDAQGQDEA